jgi:hypothetical protein
MLDGMLWQGKGVGGLGLVLPASSGVIIARQDLILGSKLYSTLLGIKQPDKLCGGARDDQHHRSQGAERLD